MDRFTLWLKDYLRELDDRERTAVILGLPVILLILYVVLVIAPIESLRENYENKLLKLKEKELAITEKLLELKSLKGEVEPFLRKAKRGKSLDPVTFFKRTAQKVGVRFKDVKTSAGREVDGIEVLSITTAFSQESLNALAEFIHRIERSGYAVKATSISITDPDRDGKVSGKLSFNLYRSKK